MMSTIRRHLGLRTPNKRQYNKLCFFLKKREFYRKNNVLNNLSPIEQFIWHLPIGSLYIGKQLICCSINNWSMIASKVNISYSYLRTIQNKFQIYSECCLSVFTCRHSSRSRRRFAFSMEICFFYICITN